MFLFDQLADDFDRWFDEEGREMYLKELGVLQELLPDFEKGLEIGVGSGRFALPLRIDYGIDPSIKLLQMAQKRGVNVVCGEAEREPFKDESFDLILITTSLCFFESPLLALKEAGRILHKGGNILIGIINRDSTIGRDYERKKRAGHPVYSKATFFTDSEVINLMEKIGMIYVMSLESLKDRDGAGFLAMLFHKPFGN